jgi:hypothetical protein
MSTKLNKKLLYWEYVEIDEEPEKFFRYNCFQRKWLQITKQPSKVRNILEDWCKDGVDNGVDAVINLISLMDKCDDPDLYLELVESAKVIADGNLSGLSERDIKEARDVASEVFKEGVLDELLHLQSEVEETEDE